MPQCSGRLTIVLIAALCAACGRMEQSSRSRPGDGAVIYQSTILTMDSRRPAAEAVIVKDGVILDLGPIDDLVQAYPGAAFDERFLRRTLMPEFVDVRAHESGIRVIEVDCLAGDLIDEIAAIIVEGWAAQEVARLSPTHPGAFGFALEAFELASGKSEGRAMIEARGPLDADTFDRVADAGAAVILSPLAPVDDCAGAAPPRNWSAADPAPSLAGRIAVAAESGDSNLLKSASAHLIDPAINRLTPQEALEAITIDAAFARGFEAELGAITPGRRAAFAVLDRNPLSTPPDSWGAITMETVNLSAVAGE